MTPVHRWLGPTLGGFIGFGAAFGSATVATSGLVDRSQSSWVRTNLGTEPWGRDYPVHSQRATNTQGHVVFALRPVSWLIEDCEIGLATTAGSPANHALHPVVGSAALPSWVGFSGHDDAQYAIWRGYGWPLRWMSEGVLRMSHSKSVLMGPSLEERDHVRLPYWREEARFVEDVIAPTWAVIAGPGRVGEDPVDNRIRVVPLRVQWRNAVLNFLIWIGACSFLGYALPAAGFGAYRMVWRRGIRLRRGLCPVCAYDMSATPDRCPECGWEARE